MSTNWAFSNLPIAKKLTLLCVIISLVSLVIAMSLIVIYDRQSFEDILKDELVVLASVISNSSAVAVIFDDRELAASNLQPLSFRRTIVAACIYKVTETEDGSSTLPLASYPGPTISCPSDYAPLQTMLLDSQDYRYIELIEPIILDDSIIGYLYLLSDTSDLQNLQTNHFLVMMVVSFFAALMAYFLAKIFAKWLSEPLLALGKTARIIADEDDYSLRAAKHHDDEIGDVVDSFNQMLSVIESENVRLRESEEIFRLISASSKVGIFQLNAEARSIYANEELSQICGLSNHQILTYNWISTIHPDDRLMITGKWQQMLKNQKAMNINCRLMNNGVKWIKGHVGLLKNTDGKTFGYLGTINDITDIKSAQIQLEQMAFYDTLTGLANRRLFRNRLEYVINNLGRENSNLGLILIDLDNFKNINDSLGHDAGDALLTIIAERLQNCVRASDTVSRLGGDEFAVILPGINVTLAASSVAEKILMSLKEPIVLRETEIRITASAGISIAPEDSNNAEELVKNADLALYRAKDYGRDNYQFYTTEMNTKLVNHLQLVSDLRKAVNNQDFSLVYQPQVDLKTGHLIGFEALIRWQHSERGFISPMEFIPAAEETGLIIPIGRWVISVACQQIHHLYASGVVDDSVAMTVNLSVQQFQDDGLVDFIASKLKQHKLKPCQFEVELTETVLMENLEQALVKLESLKLLGILISIDDFGTGYSSLGYLKQLPVDILKVDRSFVMDIPEDKDDMEITAAVIAMAHGLNYKVVAEGVETQAQLEFLEKCDCDYGQGYLFSRPLASEKIAAFCQNFSLNDIRHETID